jgi:hypothetical protein
LRGPEDGLPVKGLSHGLLEARSVQDPAATHASVLRLHPSAGEANELLLGGHAHVLTAFRTVLEGAAAACATYCLDRYRRRAVWTAPCARRGRRTHGRSLWRLNSGRSGVGCPLLTVPVPLLLWIRLIWIPAWWSLWSSLHAHDGTNRLFGMSWVEGPALRPRSGIRDRTYGFAPDLADQSP